MAKLAFNLDFYTDAQYLSYLQHHLDQDPRAAKHWSLFIESIPEFFKPIFVLYSMHESLQRRHSKRLQRCRSYNFRYSGL
ncbi:hypothetical protein BDE02_02G109000 [Populus trichocarpa]|nr:hypothetical protein BDE02_02G109000 [Populus trichocarpa]